MIRTLIVDDSAVMRALIRAQLEATSDIVVVGDACDPIEARAAIKTLNPDVVTLDVEMPNMNGIEFLEKLMRLRPTPVIMVSTLTHHGAETAIRALELGAVDCVGKPTGPVADFGGLADKVRVAAVARLRPIGDAPPARPPAAEHFVSNGRIVAIGSSTGGVEALIQLLTSFPAECPPTVITQHMPATFIKSFAARLDRLCAPSVEEARDGARLERGLIYLAPGGDTHLRIEGRAGLRCRLDPAPPVNGHRPSVDVLFQSVAIASGRQSIGVILTGMGRDGAAGLLAMRKAGAHTLGQDEASCVVYGMPKSAFDLGAVERQAPLSRLSTHILALASAGAGA